MSGDLTDSGNHKPTPWVGPDGEPDEENVVQQYGDALIRAGERCLSYPGLLRRARQDDLRDPRPHGQLSRADELRSALIRFIRITIGANTIAVAALGGLPDVPLTKETR